MIRLIMRRLSARYMIIRGNSFRARDLPLISRREAANAAVRAKLCGRTIVLVEQVSIERIGSARFERRRFADAAQIESVWIEQRRSIERLIEQLDLFGFPAMNERTNASVAIDRLNSSLNGQLLETLSVETILAQE